MQAPTENRLGEWAAWVHIILLLLLLCNILCNPSRNDYIQCITFLAIARMISWNDSIFGNDCSNFFHCCSVTPFTTLALSFTVQNFKGFSFFIFCCLLIRFPIDFSLNCWYYSIFNENEMYVWIVFMWRHQNLKKIVFK